MVISVILALAVLLLISRTFARVAIILLTLALVLGTIWFVDHMQHSNVTEALPNLSPSPGKKNIYGLPLETCESRGPAALASQLDDYTCSEVGGGFHQICVENIGRGNSFSSTTGQSNWSDGLGERNHCACLGAWANFVSAGENDKSLKCSAIPEYALAPEYVQNWRQWNDVTIQGQAKKGLDELYRQCVSRAPSPEAADYLLSKYSKIVNRAD